MPCRPARPAVLARRLPRVLPAGPALLALPVLLALLVAGCAESRPPARPQPPETEAAATVRRERAYLLNPLEGYAQTVDPGRRERLTRGFEILLSTGSVVEARQTGTELLEVAPGFAPAKVLLAQADFATGNDRAVIDRLLAVGDAQPNYTAGQLLMGRAAERAGDLALAYAAFRAVATRSGKAFERTGDLHARALQIVGQRLAEALRSDRPDRLAEADRQLALLKAWAPGERPTLEGERAIAAARHDPRAELEAVKGLSALQPDDRGLLDRRADLELEVGDPGVGLKIVQALADRHPEDPELAEKVRIARFRWQVSLLPGDVRERAGKDELSRADFSVLLYWLVPQVRYGRSNAGRIATDILDDPHREEIVHVLNLGLLDVDPTLHHFSPAAPLRRGTALRCLGRLLTGFAGSAGSGHQVSCAAGAAGGAGGGAAGPCQLGAACGLIAGEEACDAGSTLSGADALEWIRRSLVLLGGGA